MSQRLVHRLLAGRRGPTRREKDDLFAAVMREVAPPPRRRAWLAPALAVLGAAAAALLMPRLVRRGEAPPAFAARGDAGAATFSAFCAGGPCRPGDTLLLEVAPDAWPHFTAFARRDDGTVIWYQDAAAARPGVMGTGIVLDDVHRPGTYHVYGVFSRAALDRDAIRARFQPGADETTASAGPDTAVVVRELVIR